MSKKHVLLVTIDSLRADHLSCYGASHLETPCLDSFANAGVRFEQHLTTISATLPSHTSLLTGCPPSFHDVTWNNVKRERRRRTLPEILQQEGYATTAQTSWNGFKAQGVFGFQRFHSEGKAADLNNRGEKTLARVQDWIGQCDPSQPQLLWTHIIDPHAPDNCPEPFEQSYRGEVQFTDKIMGELLDSWDKKLGTADSLVIVTADHAEHLNDHEVVRGHGTLWRICLHVPLLIRSPGQVQAGQVVPELTRQIDVLPTILDYLEVPCPHNLAGTSLRGLIEGSDRDLRLIHSGQILGEERAATTIRSGPYAFHFDKQDRLVHVFDLLKDPQEERDLWAGGAAGYSAEHSIRDAEG